MVPGFWPCLNPQISRKFQHSVSQTSNLHITSFGQCVTCPIIYLIFFFKIIIFWFHPNYFPMSWCPMLLTLWVWYTNTWDFSSSCMFKWGFPGGSDNKESACNTGDLGWEDSLEEGMANHSSILATMDRGACRWAKVHGVAVGNDWRTKHSIYSIKFIIINI